MIESKEREGGYMVMMALLFFLAMSAAVIAGVSNSVFREVRTIKNEALSKQSYFTSESAVEDVAFRMKNGQIVPASSTLDMGSTTAAVTISTVGGNTEVVSEGDASGTERTTKLVLSNQGGISFKYAAYSGIGGIDLLDGVDISGDVYTLGSIRGCGTCSVSGEAIAAGRSVEALDQDNSAPIPPTQSIVFGNANASQDLAQSFTVSDARSIIRLELYVKKTGNPANATVRITTDNAGKPSSTILASGSLLSSAISSSYGWVQISLTANPILSIGTTYWILVDASSNSSNYYTIGANSAYAAGQAKVGRYTNNSWSNTTPAGLDGFFKIYIGENQDGVTGTDQWNMLTVGSSYSYEASYVTSIGELFCQIGTLNNKSCNTTRADPAIENEPVPASVITTWKSEAETSIRNSSLSVGWAGATVGPKKIEGDLSVSGGGELRISGTVWVTGNITINGGSLIRPDDPTKNYVIVTDGTVNLSGGAEVIGGGPNSNILLVSTSAADPAITIQGGANDTVVYVPNGGVLATGGATLKAMGAYHITIGGGADLIYDPSISIFNLSSGISGGGFKIKSWKETQ